jgi:hypothetical protein
MFRVEVFENWSVQDRNTLIRQLQELNEAKKAKGQLDGTPRAERKHCNDSDDRCPRSSQN